MQINPARTKHDLPASAANVLAPFVPGAQPEVRTIRQLVQSMLGKCGYKLVRVDAPSKPARGLASFFVLLKQLGFSPKHIIDVGANTGGWTREAVKVFPDADYTLVEPQDHLKTCIQDLIDHGYKIHWINAGAGDRPGRLPFTVSRRNDSSSFVPTQQQARTSGLEQITVEVKTLNEIVSAGSAPPPDMVKIDAEGFDLKVLSGATDLLGKTDLFLVEALICARGYENTILEVIRRMADAGYQLMDITELNRSPRHGVLWLCELAFLRKGSPLLDTASSYE